MKKGSYHTAWSVPLLSSCSCSHACGQGTSVGSHSGERCWPLQAGLWMAIAPLMKPLCAEGEVPTAANLNLYRGRGSCVRWHCDDELLFGERWESKLIVSVRFGTEALFKWKGKCCPDGEAGTCCFGQCQDEFLRCTDPGLEQERISVTFRWIRQHTASCPLRTGEVCCLPTCAQGSSAAVTTVVGVRRFWDFLGAPWSLVFLGGTVFASVPPSCVQDSGYKGVPIAGHAFWAEVGGGIFCVTLGEFAGLLTVRQMHPG